MWGKYTLSFLVMYVFWRNIHFLPHKKKKKQLKTQVGFCSDYLPGEGKPMGKKKSYISSRSQQKKKNAFFCFFFILKWRNVRSDENIKIIELALCEGLKFHTVTGIIKKKKHWHRGCGGKEPSKQFHCCQKQYLQCFHRKLLRVDNPHLCKMLGWLQLSRLTAFTGCGWRKMFIKWKPVLTRLLRGFPKANRISDLRERGFGLIVCKLHLAY